MEVPGFYKIIEEGYSLDHVYMLIEMKRGVIMASGSKASSLLQFLLRKGLCTEDFTVTKAGEQLIELATTATSVPVKRMSVDDYTRWIKAFPLSDGFTWRGKTFTKTRTLRKNSEKTRELFRKVIREGEYTTDDLINAIIAESRAKMEDSVKKGENKMSFITNSESYLRQRVFEGFIEDGRKLTEEQIKEYYSAFIPNKKVTESSSIDI